MATSPGSSCAPECALQSLPSGGLLPYLCSHLQVRQGRAIPQVPHRCPTGAPQMPHRHTPACRHVRGWFLPGGWTGAEHREWQLDTLKSYINVNKPTISAPAVTISMLSGLRSLVQLTNLTSLYICLLSPSSWMLKGRYTLVETRHRPWRLRSKDLLKQVKTKAEFKGYDPAVVCFKSRHIISPYKAPFLLFSQAWLLALLFISHQKNLRHHP